MDTYSDPVGYDRYMAPWSAEIAPAFAAFAGAVRDDLTLDVGCGTGVLLTTLASRFQVQRLVGVDPQPAALARARSDNQAPGSLVVGRAEQLPFANGAFDSCLSLLVLQEFPDLGAALSEMTRVVRPGGIVAGCQWNYADMPIISAVIEVLSRIGASDNDAPTRAKNEMTDEGLAAAWREARCRDVVADRVTVRRVYRGFEHLWETLLRGSTPSTMALASLSGDKLNEARSHIAEILFEGRTDETPIVFSAEALLVKGMVAASR